MASVIGQRDPVSEWFDEPAIALLRRAYAEPEEWAGQYLAPPSKRARATLALMGVDPYEVDRWGEVRWVRAFKRSVFYQLRHHGYASGLRLDADRTSDWPGRALEWQTGRRVTKAGWPTARWAIRVRLHPSGSAAHSAALRKVPPSKRWIDPGTGRATELQSQPADRA